MALYTVRNVLSVATHYTATGLLLAGSIALGSPWVLGASAVLVGGISVLSVATQRKFLEEGLVRQPESSEYSPNLGKIAQELYSKTGLKAADYPIYDFRADEEKEKAATAAAEAAGKPESKMKKAFREMSKKAFDKMGQTHNAAAMNFGKPVIMVSTPLLKLLNDEEEKAVLAHEFVHAAARHNYLGLPHNLIAGVATLSNGLTSLGAAFATGFTGVAASVGARIATSYLFNKATDSKKELSADDLFLTPAQKHKKLVLDRTLKVINAVVGTAVYTYFSHAYLGIYAATKALSLAGKVLVGSFSRSMEYQADRGAVKLGANPLALVTSLRKMKLVQERSVEAALGEKLPEKGALTKAWAKLTASHPTVEARVKRLCKIAAKSGFTPDQIKAAANDTLVVAAEHNMSPRVVMGLMR
ncbi:MAG: M48 family metalloprotease [Micavibrio sp.]|nr:M48 family metalloprotease [Micavibrio sp.]